jgi:hypothetical protein
MMNYQVFGLCGLLRLLLNEEDSVISRVQFIQAQKTGAAKIASALLCSSDDIDDTDKHRVRGLLQYAKQVADQLEMTAVHHRLEVFAQRLRFRLSAQEFATELRVLREAIEGELNFRYFYHYPQSKALVLLHVEADWEFVFQKFKSARDDAIAGVDCWALGHSTEAVFPSMRSQK